MGLWNLPQASEQSNCPLIQATESSVIAFTGLSNYAVLHDIVAVRAITLRMVVNIFLLFKMYFFCNHNSSRECTNITRREASLNFNGFYFFQWRGHDNTLSHFLRYNRAEWKKPLFQIPKCLWSWQCDLLDSQVCTIHNSVSPKSSYNVDWDAEIWMEVLWTL